MQVARSISVLHAFAPGAVIELGFGDLSKLEPGADEYDLLIISAFPGDYSAVPGTLIGALSRNKGLSVGQLARDKDPADDLRQVFGCWLSKPIDSKKQVGFKRLLCFERGRQLLLAAPAKTIGSMFRAVIAAAADTESMLIPLLASGNQQVDPMKMLAATVEAAVHWMQSGLELRRCTIVVFSPSGKVDAKAIAVFEKAVEATLNKPGAGNAKAALLAPDAPLPGGEGAADYSDLWAPSPIPREEAEEANEEEGSPSRRMPQPSGAALALKKAGGVAAISSSLSSLFRGARSSSAFAPSATSKKKSAQPKGRKSAAAPDGGSGGGGGGGGAPDGGGSEQEGGRPPPPPPPPGGGPRSAPRRAAPAAPAAPAPPLGGSARVDILIVCAHGDRTAADAVRKLLLLDEPGLVVKDAAAWLHALVDVDSDDDAIRSDVVADIVRQCTRVTPLLSKSFLTDELCSEFFASAFLLARSGRRPRAAASLALLPTLEPILLESANIPRFMMTVQYHDCRPAGAAAPDRLFARLAPACFALASPLAPPASTRKVGSHTDATGAMPSGGLGGAGAADAGGVDAEASSGGYEVFISYSHAFSASAKAVRELLLALRPSLRIFLDVNGGLRAGTSWQVSARTACAQRTSF
ncbi:hypothetical protein T492DRAFT_303215 [Pavlovales sp. CCMP2436]|nr:hypothetical protein T492DRAFT_303215 [Pavlovales sp. CCMP2436]